MFNFLRNLVNFGNLFSKSDNSKTEKLNQQIAELQKQVAFLNTYAKISHISGGLNTNGVVATFKMFEVMKRAKTAEEAQQIFDKIYDGVYKDATNSEKSKKLIVDLQNDAIKELDKGFFSYVDMKENDPETKSKHQKMEAEAQKAAQEMADMMQMLMGGTPNPNMGAEMFGFGAPESGCGGNCGGCGGSCDKDKKDNQQKDKFDLDDLS